MIIALIVGRLDGKWSNSSQCTSGHKDSILHVQQGIFLAIQVPAFILKEKSPKKITSPDPAT